MSRYPGRLRKPASQWTPTGRSTKDLGDDDWGSDVDVADSEEEEMDSDDSLHEFIDNGDESDDDFASDTEDELTDEDTLSCESSDSEWEHDDPFVSPIRRIPEDPQDGSDCRLDDDTV